MTQTKLPTELLLHILSYLTPNEKRQGLLICKDWYEAFRYALYIHVTVQNLCQLKLLFNSLLCSSHYNYSQQMTAIPNGYLIRNLILHKRTANHCLNQKMLIQEKVIMPRILFDQLPDLCPNLEVLDFDPETFRFIRYHNSVSKWKTNMRQLPTIATLVASLPFLRCLGEGLVSLSIQSNMILDLSSRLSSILLLVSNVVELKIQGDDGGDGNNTRPTTLSLNISDLELIHKLLPRLKLFKIIGNDIQMRIGSTSTMVSLIENLPTAPNIKTVHWNTPHIPPAWVLYVTHKYPSLRNLTLSLQQTQQQQDQNQQHAFTTQQQATTQQEALLYTSILKKCPHLENISLACPRLDDWFNSSFFRILDDSRIIKQVSAIIQKGNQIKHDAELVLATQPKHGHLISALEIEQWRLDTKLPCTLQLLKNLTQLVYLDLKCDSYHAEYNVDTVLNSCPHLTSLILEWGTLLTPSNDTATTAVQHRHPLKRLITTFVAFSPDIFSYLSNQCRSLSELIITKCKQLCELENTSSQTLVQINMPNNHFDFIMLDGIRLDYLNASVSYHGLSSYIQLVAIKDDDDSKIAAKYYRHVGYTTTTRATNQKVPVNHLLNEQDRESTQEYFSRRERCAFVISYDHSQYLESAPGSKEEEEEVIKSERLKKSWTYGLIKIRCKSLKHFVLDGHVTY